MNKQCLDIEQMRHLKDLGVDTSKAIFYWHRTKSLNNYEDWDEWKLHYGVLNLARGFKTINCEYVRTFTLQDVLDLLPKEIMDKDEDKFVLKFEYGILHGIWYIGYYYYDVAFNDKCWFSGKNLIDAAYEMLCWCIENGYIKTNKED